MSKLLFVQTIKEAGCLTRDGFDFKDWVVVATTPEPLYLLRKNGINAIYICDFFHLSGDDSLLVKSYELVKGIVDSEIVRRIWGAGASSLSYSLLITFVESIQTHLAVDAIFSRENPSEVASVIYKNGSFEENIEHNSFFSSILKYHCQERNVRLKILEEVDLPSLGAGKPNRVRHLVTFWAAPFIQFLMKTVFRRGEERSWVWLLFRYDADRHMDLLETLRERWGKRRTVWLFSKLSLDRLMFNPYFYVGRGKYPEREVNAFFDQRRWQDIFRANPIFDKYPYLFKNEAFDGTWRELFTSMHGWSKEFSEMAAVIKRVFNPEVAITTSPFRKYLFVLNNLKQMGVKLHVVSHAGWLSHPLLLGNSPDFYHVWGQAHKDYLMHYGVSGDKIAICGNPKYTAERRPNVTRSRSEIMKGLGLPEDARLITLITYPYNGRGGVFDELANVDNSIFYRTIAKILSIDFQNHGWALVIKSHPQIDMHFIYDDYAGERIRNVKRCDLSELAAATDVFVSVGALSTLVYDFLMFEKPFVFLRCGEGEFWLKQVSRLGKVVTTLDDIEPELSHILADQSAYQALSSQSKVGLEYLVGKPESV